MSKFIWYFLMEFRGRHGAASSRASTFRDRAVSRPTAPRQKLRKGGYGVKCICMLGTLMILYFVVLSNFGSSDNIPKDIAPSGGNPKDIASIGGSPKRRFSKKGCQADFERKSQEADALAQVRLWYGNVRWGNLSGRRNLRSGARDRDSV